MFLSSRFLVSLLVALGVAAPASADLITGQVVDSNGVPVPNVDIDIEDMATGSVPTIFNDGTDALGNFAVTVPAGNWRVLFIPPPPPATLSLITVFDDVLVSGTKAMGVVTLDPGTGLQGRLVDSLGIPVGPPGGLPVGTDLSPYSAKITLINLATGDEPALPGKGSVKETSGVFFYAVPPGDYEMIVVPPVISVSTLAPVVTAVSVVGAVDLGDVILPPAAAVTGIVLDPSGLPLGGMDFDVYDPATGAKLFTPHDSTQSTGFFNLSLPFGTWDVVADPPVGLKLISWNTTLTISGADVSLGLVQLQPGNLLSGHVQSSLSASEAGVDIDVSDAATGDIVYTNSSDNTDSSGNYKVIVPDGVFEVQFSPKSFLDPLGAEQVPGVVVGGDLVLNATLPDCPFDTPYGLGLAGSGGFVPVLATAGGTPRAGNLDWGFSLSNTIGGTVGVVVVGFGQTSVPLYGGTLLVDIFSLPPAYLFGTTGGSSGVAGSGSTTIAPPFPIDGAWSGLTIYCQGATIDSGAPAGFALSNGISVTFCP
jgi:hypothetical protein